MSDMPACHIASSRTGYHSASEGHQHFSTSGIARFRKSDRTSTATQDELLWLGDHIEFKLYILLDKYLKFRITERSTWESLCCANPTPLCTKVTPNRLQVDDLYPKRLNSTWQKATDF